MYRLCGFPLFPCQPVEASPGGFPHNNTSFFYYLEVRATDSFISISTSPRNCFCRTKSAHIVSKNQNNGVLCFHLLKMCCCFSVVGVKGGLSRGNEARGGPGPGYLQEAQRCGQDYNAVLAEGATSMDPTRRLAIANGFAAVSGGAQILINEWELRGMLAA